MTRYEMCESEKMLSVLKKQPNKGGLSEGSIMLAESQAKDITKIMGKQSNMEKEIIEIKQIQVEQSVKIDSLDNKIDLVIGLIKGEQSCKIEKEKSKWEFLTNLSKQMGFWVVIIVVLFFLFGRNLSELAGIVKMGN